MSEAVEAENLVIEFENQSGDMFWIKQDKMCLWGIFKMTEIESDILCDMDDYAVTTCGLFHITSFQYLDQAERCAEALKESV